MTCRATTVVKRIEKAFPHINGVEVRRTDEIFLGDVAEGGEIDDFPACDYYSFDFDPHEKIYIMGVHKKLKKVVEDCGWFVECGDPGTYYAYPA
jgi:hypothetical protein